MSPVMRSTIGQDMEVSWSSISLSMILEGDVSLEWLFQ